MRCRNETRLFPGEKRCDDRSSRFPLCVCTAACSADEFACGAGSRQDCIPARWRCDSDNDCGNNADEAPDLCGQFIHITSGQRTLTKGCPMRTSLQPRAAAAFAAYTRAGSLLEAPTRPRML